MIARGLSACLIVTVCGMMASLSPLSAMGQAQPVAAATRPADAAKPIVKFWARRVVGMLATRDGVSLRYSVLLPKGKGPFPVIVSYSGYDTGSIGGSTYSSDDATFSTDIDRSLIERGYAIMGVNARGTACSAGRMDLFGTSYGRDGYDIVEFAASQPWSTGAIGMMNWSWAGISQVMTAAERPPHLKAIAPGMIVGDWRRDNGAPGGVYQPGFVALWRDYILSRWDAAERSAKTEHDEACIANLEKNRASEPKLSASYLLMTHPLRDGGAGGLAPTAQADRIAIPVLSMESFQDEAVTTRGDYFQRRLNPATTWLVQSNGGHDLYMSHAFRPVLLSFYDRFVNGIRNGFERRPHVSVWMETGSTSPVYTAQQQIEAQPRWSFTRDEFGEQGLATRTWWLAPMGRLVDRTPSADASDAVSYPAPGPSVYAENVDSWLPAQSGLRDRGLAYTSPVFERDLIVYGSGSLDIWVSSDGPDADLQATVTEIRPDGQEMFVQRGWLRLSNRLLDERQSTPLLPWPRDTPSDISPPPRSTVVLARVEINKFAHAFRAGSKLRIWIDTPTRTGDYIFDTVTVPSTMRIFSGPAYPSVLRLGEVHDVRAPAARPACGTVIHQPCRPDPLAAR